MVGPTKPMLLEVFEGLRGALGALCLLTGRGPTGR